MTGADAVGETHGSGESFTLWRRRSARQARRWAGATRFSDINTAATPTI